MTLDKISVYLSERKRSFNPEIMAELNVLKKDAIEKEDEELANEVWYYETISQIQLKFLQIFDDLQADDYDKYLSVWCEIDHICILFYFLRNNFSERDKQFFLPHIEAITAELVKLYPYEVFLSRETIVKREECSICGKELTPRNRCAHIPGKLYWGELCSRNVKELELLAMAIVEHPFDKYCVLFDEVTKYNYCALQELMHCWFDPYQTWHTIVTKKLLPEFRGAKVNLACPCGSGIKYKKCCMDTPSELMEHTHIAVNGVGPKLCSSKIYRTKIPLEISKIPDECEPEGIRAHAFLQVR